MAENRNKLRGSKSKAPIIYTFIVMSLLGLAIIFYASYAYLGYVRTNKIDDPGICRVWRGM